MEAPTIIVDDAVRVRRANLIKNIEEYYTFRPWPAWAYYPRQIVCHSEYLFIDQYYCDYEVFEYVSWSAVQSNANYAVIEGRFVPLAHELGLLLMVYKASQNITVNLRWYTRHGPISAAEIRMYHVSCHEPGDLRARLTESYLYQRDRREQVEQARWCALLSQLGLPVEDGQDTAAMQDTIESALAYHPEGDIVPHLAAHFTTLKRDEV